MTNPNQTGVYTTTTPEQSESTEAAPSHESKKMDSNMSVAEEQQQMKSCVSQITNMPEANLDSQPTFLGNWHHGGMHHALGQHNFGRQQALPAFANDYLSNPSFTSFNNIHPSSLHQQLLLAKSTKPIVTTLPNLAALTQDQSSIVENRSATLISQNDELGIASTKIPSEISAVCGGSVRSSLSSDMGHSQVEMTRKAFAALDNILKLPMPKKFDLGGIIDMGIPVPHNLLTTDFMKRAECLLTQQHLRKVLPNELSSDSQFVTKLNDSLKQLQEMMRVIAKEVITRVMTIMEIGRSSGGWISSKKELINKIEHMSIHDYGRVFSVALRGAFVCNIFQKCDNNAYGNRVVQYVTKMYKLELAPGPALGRSADHCFVQYARIIYDRIGQSVLNSLRAGGSVFWTTQLKKLSRGVDTLGSLCWTTHNVYFYRKNVEGKANDQVGMEKGGLDTAKMGVTGNHIVVESADASVLDGAPECIITGINGPTGTVRLSGTKDAPAATLRSLGTTNVREDNIIDNIAISDNNFEAKQMHRKMRDDHRDCKAIAIEFAAQSRTLRVAAAAVRQQETTDKNLKRQKKKDDLRKLRQTEEANNMGKHTNMKLLEDARMKRSADGNNNSATHKNTLEAGTETFNVDEMPTISNKSVPAGIAMNAVMQKNNIKTVAETVEADVLQGSLGNSFESGEVTRTVMHESTCGAGTETAVDVDKNQRNLGESVEVGEVLDTSVAHENSCEAGAEIVQDNEVQVNLGEAGKAVHSVRRKKQCGQINHDNNKLDQGSLQLETNKRKTSKRKTSDGNKLDRGGLLSDNNKRKTMGGNQSKRCARESVELVTTPGCCGGQTLKEHLASCEAGRNSLTPLDDLW
eukprot:CAMPEP_0196802918 /NCGR_PEP_ID=MMETSP1362-20130617/2423_1 /TAXON_ID=163516 /ORGANISM="Leptocylindrus danicus, Strain CCMP1856" /LENGTH=860 /DNA_ID=CAMNT_0042174331 /DNA_START=1 /DNA_END=2580 /DNA_ORIENTATION=-